MHDHKLKRLKLYRASVNFQEVEQVWPIYVTLSLHDPLAVADSHIALRISIKYAYILIWNKHVQAAIEYA